ncbi:MAG: Asp-tRNA(Asn)/Glu-tRNA(Gln) amidotransferase subunit GatB [Clostridia bacterium]|nr:Asp-tRNA(Asn)/Glu-tRNA(Gln) amidotransferase subunit GatB [Clostridia bacterium]
MEYEVIIGLEVHAELSTKTKIFCGCTTEFGGDPNTHCCPVCTGMPGALPVLNEKVVEYAVKAGLATGCQIATQSKQDRKNYFYPDTPRAYQISQYDMPLCENGKVEIDVNGAKKEIGITRIHIEDDAGKLVHDSYTGGTLVDLNRAGVPLIEIVSEPDLRSAEEAVAYVEKLKGILEYIGVSDCKMQEGSLRADVNLSIRPMGSDKFGTRTETKNLNSFRAIAKCIEFEIQRQKDVIESGGVIYQETRRWDDVAGEGYAMRAKEDAHDYRYFPEPDLMPINLSEEYIKNLKDNLPELPESRKARYIEEMNLPEYDAGIITSSKALSDFFEAASKECGNAKAVSNWIMTDIIRIAREGDFEYSELPFTPVQFAGLIKLIDKGTISGSIAKKVFEEMVSTGKDAEKIVEEKGLVQISDEGAIKEVVDRIIAANPQSIVDYKAGKDRALGFLVGQCMKEMKGKGNPQILNKLILEELQK